MKRIRIALAEKKLPEFKPANLDGQITLNEVTVSQRLGDFMGETNNLFDKVQKDLDQFIRDAFEKYANPPIIGDITKEKIEAHPSKFEIIRQQTHDRFYTWLAQDGKQISPKFEIKFRINPYEGN